MKAENKERLQEDLIRISIQIGILDNERPKLIFNRNEMNELAAKHADSDAHNALLKGDLGRCFGSQRTIFVNERPTARNNTINRKIHGKGSLKGYYRLIPKKWNYHEQRHTLVHELIHYRFPYMQHGREFDDRILQISRGKTFEPKHIHLFEGYQKKYTLLIDGSTKEDIQKYHEVEAKRKAGYEEYNKKCRLYWQVRKQLEDKINVMELDMASYLDIKEFIDKTNNRRIPIEQSIDKLQKRLDLLNTG